MSNKKELTDDKTSTETAKFDVESTAGMPGVAFRSTTSHVDSIIRRTLTSRSRCCNAVRSSTFPILLMQDFSLMPYPVSPGDT